MKNLQDTKSCSSSPPLYILTREAILLKDLMMTWNCDEKLARYPGLCRTLMAAISSLLANALGNSYQLIWYSDKCE